MFLKYLFFDNNIIKVFFHIANYFITRNNKIA